MSEYGEKIRLTGDTDNDRRGSEVDPRGDQISPLTLAAKTVGQILKDMPLPMADRLANVLGDIRTYIIKQMTGHDRVFTNTGSAARGKITLRGPVHLEESGYTEVIPELYTRVDSDGRIKITTKRTGQYITLKGTLDAGEEDEMGRRESANVSKYIRLRRTSPDSGHNRMIRLKRIASQHNQAMGEIYLNIAEGDQQTMLEMANRLRRYVYRQEVFDALGLSEDREPDIVANELNNPETIWMSWEVLYRFANKFQVPLA